MRRLVRIAALLGAAVTLFGCGERLSGAIDRPPIFPAESIQGPDAYWSEGAARETGHGLLRNDEAAAAAYRKAIDRHDIRAMVDLGVMYAQGRGVARDYSEAVSLFERAEKAGSAVARYDLALMHLSGEGTRIDVPLAASLLRQASSQGHLRSMSTLAAMIEAGIVPEAAPGEAANLRRTAAERGEVGEVVHLVPTRDRRDPTRPVVSDAVRQLVAGTCANCEPPEVERSTREFIYLESDQSPGAMYELAVRYRDADGVPRDMRQAARLFATAARKGHVPSQYELARMRISGLGIRRDYREADALLIAASRGEGFDAVRARDLRRNLELSMSRYDIEKSMKRADAGEFGEVDEKGRPR